MSKSRIPVWAIAALLALVTLGLYWPATRCGFVNYDDQLYVTENAQVQKGLTWEGMKWACVTPVSCNWHPLTVWSHELDCQLFGLNPWGHHLTSVVLHAINAGLVFVLLQLMTGAPWRSLLVAALFALHPLRVESVAWVSERKGVLSAFFGLLALIAYVRYAQCRKQKAESRKQKAEIGMQKPETPDTQHPSSVAALRRVDATRNPHHAPRTTHHATRSTLHAPSFYLLSLLFFALGLMSKPMLVTWPFVLLLLDYWPLGRMQKAECRMQNADGSDTQHATRNTQHPSRTTHHAPRIHAVALGVGEASILCSCGGSVCRDLRRAAARRRHDERRRHVAGGAPRERADFLLPLPGEADLARESGGVLSASLAMAAGVGGACGRGAPGPLGADLAGKAALSLPADRLVVVYRHPGPGHWAGASGRTRNGRSLYLSALARGAHPRRLGHLRPHPRLAVSGTGLARSGEAWRLSPAWC